MSDTKATVNDSKQQTENQRKELGSTEDGTKPSEEPTQNIPDNSTSTEPASATTTIPTDVPRSGGVNLTEISVVEQHSVGALTASSSGGVLLPTAPIRCPPVERQTSVGSIDSTTMSLGAGTGNAGGGSVFRSTISNGRMFSRLMSVERARPNNHGPPSRRGSNFSNVMLNDFMTLLQQARHPSSLFSSERTGLFLNPERSHGTGTSTPPIGTSSSTGTGSMISSSNDVVIDVDDGSGPAGATSLRSSHNELYPISNSPSTTTNVRPFLWMQSGEDNATSAGTSVGGRSPLVPNFNYNHHHHHFHNHQPLSLHHQPSAIPLTTMVAMATPVSNGGGEGGSPMIDDSMANVGVPTPTSGIMPTIGGGGTTRSNSVSSNHQNDDATVHEALNQFPETRALIETLARYMPLLLILVAKLCYDHLDGIMHFLLLLMTFYHANWVVRQEISKQKQRRVIVLLRELIIIIGALLIFGFVIEWKSICLVILFMPDHLQPESLKSLLFAVCITDLILKLITIGIKIIITLMPPKVVDYKSRGKVYLLIESLSQLYRAAAPIRPWLIFLFESYSGSEKMVGVILSAVYIVAKSTDLLDRFKFCRRSFIKLLQKTSYGTVPTKEQLQACGGQCSICHDNFNSPVLLECNHIFCELCVGTWFDREQTCPLCRAKIVDDPSYRDGATTFFLQLY